MDRPIPAFKFPSVFYPHFLVDSLSGRSGLWSGLVWHGMACVFLLLFLNRTGILGLPRGLGVIRRGFFNHISVLLGLLFFPHGKNGNWHAFAANDEYLVEGFATKDREILARYIDG